MALFLWLSAVAAFVDIGLVLGLLAMYSQSYRKVRSPFTLGLLLFGIFLVLLLLAVLGFWLFLFTNVASASPLVASFVETASLWLFVINAAMAVALASLLRVTWK